MFEPVARVDDLPEGSLLEVETQNGQRICLANVKGEIVALSDTCTHQDFPIVDGTLLPDGTIECAWHGARFDCRTGDVKKLPATDPLPVYEVRVENGAILVGGRKR